MIHSVATSYALRALATLPDDGDFFLSKDLADYLGLPGPFLSKILQTLSQAGILQAVRGPKGGYRLARPAHRITLRQVVKAMDGGPGWGVCPLGFVNCEDANGCCPFHDAWCEVKERLEKTLDTITVADLQPMDLRCADGQPKRRIPVRATPAAS
jgi:Rrf2 family protein